MSRTRLGEDLFKKSPKANAELFILTYGALVAQLCKEQSDAAKVNQQLVQMGYRIGIRLIEDFFANSNIGRCAEFRDTAEVISKIAFRMFLNIIPTVGQWSSEGDAFTLTFDDNPLSEFCELPEANNLKSQLWYSNIYCGIICGALEMIQLKVSCEFQKDVLRGDDTTEIRVKFLEYLKDEIPVGE